MEPALHRRQAASGKRFDGVDAVAVDHCRERQTRQPRLIVNQHRAGAALATVAARFRAGQADDFPQIVQQQHVIRYRIAACAAVERQLKNARHADGSGFLYNTLPHSSIGRAVQIGRRG